MPDGEAIGPVLAARLALAQVVALDDERLRIVRTHGDHGSRPLPNT